MNKLLKMALLTPALAGVLSQSAAACAVCMGSADQDIAPAMNASMGFLLGAIALVGCAFFGFLIYLAKRDGVPAEPHRELGATAPAPQQS